MHVRWVGIPSYQICVCFVNVGVGVGVGVGAGVFVFVLDVDPGTVLWYCACHPRPEMLSGPLFGVG